MEITDLESRKILVSLDFADKLFETLLNCSLEAGRVDLSMVEMSTYEINSGLIQEMITYISDKEFINKQFNQSNMNIGKISNQN